MVTDKLANPDGVPNTGENSFHNRLIIPQFISDHLTAFHHESNSL